MKVGIGLPVGEMDGLERRPVHWPDIRRIALAAEAGGLDSAWVADHFLHRTGTREQGLHEAWTLLAALAASTDRIELGPLVLAGSFRNPALVAKMAATLDDLSGGRLVLGLGSGWHDPEYDAFGIPRDRRVSRFAEGLEITARLLRGERVTFEGAFERAQDAVLLPPPGRRVPILVAAEGPRMLRLAARWADAWVTAWYGPVGPPLRRQLAAFDEALAEVGRDPTGVARVVGVTLRDEAQPSVEEPEADAITGSIDDVARALQAYEALGVDHLIVGLEPISERSVERLAAAVAVRRSGS